MVSRRPLESGHGVITLTALRNGLLLPPGNLMLLFVAGALLVRCRPRLGKSLCAAAMALLYMLSTGLGSWMLARPLEGMETPIDAGSGARAQAIVVLTAGHIRSSPEYGNRSVPDLVAIERMTYAAHLARITSLPLMVTGGIISDEAGDDPLAISMARLFDSAFGLQVRWVEALSRTTEENASMSAVQLRRDGIARIVLVTDAMHMRRARKAFERHGLTVIAGPTFYTASRRFNPGELLPSAEYLRRSCYAVYEWVALARYQFF